MKLMEQMYKNLNRPYYRGHREDWAEDASFYDEVYYTTNPIYAFFYSLKERKRKKDLQNNQKEDGIISEYRLRDGVDIFNLKSKKDYFTLHKYLNDTNNSKLLSELEKLKIKDWSFQLNGDIYRKELIAIIKDLGYDGYFNYEFDQESMEKLKSFGFDDIPFESNNPSIGVFNNNIFKKVRTWTLDEFIDSDFTVKYKQKEIEELRGYYISRSKYGFSKEELYKMSIFGLEHIFLSEEEAKEEIKKLEREFTPEKIKEEIRKDLTWILNDRRISIPEEKRRIFEKILKES